MKTGLIFLWGMCALSATAQTVIKRDAVITQMVNEVSAKNIEANVRKLVSFRTRHSLSDTTSKTEGIGAARNWVKSEYEKYAKESGGRMTVEFDAFVQPKSSRVTQPTPLKNILAILKGTNPDDKRVYIVSGHYDSMLSNVMDSVTTAPGANDDAFGTAVSIPAPAIQIEKSYSSVGAN